jgi:hypothetical protein
VFDGIGGAIYFAENMQRQAETECDAYGENLVKATSHGAGWTLHHDAINLQVHRIVRQSGMVSNMEVEDLFLRKLQESAITLDDFMPLLSKHLKGGVFGASLELRAVNIRQEWANLRRSK